ncbi:MAG: ATP synthase F1 subunit delta [Pirellulales bacterium]|nr:ATP synthase F1 subunit delta [Pirellulales bacterium]
MSESANASTRETVFDVDVEKLARIYAQAALDAAGDQQNDLMEELKSLDTGVLDVFPEFEEVLASALISQDEKLAMLDRVFGGQLSTTGLSFLKVLAGHDRLGLLRQVVRSAAQLMEKRNGRLLVEIQFAHETSSSLVDDMVAVLEKKFGAESVIKVVINPKLIAGFVVRVGDKVYDSSARTSFEQVRTRMIGRAVDAIQSHPEQFMKN